MKAYNTAVLTLMLVAFVGIAAFLFKLIKEDTPVAQPEETQSRRQIDIENPETTNTIDFIGPPVPSKIGSIEGNLCYPSEFIPALDVYAQNVVTEQFEHLVTQENQGTYTIDKLNPGTYIAYAYRQDSAELGGGYTYAVPCGLTVSCTNQEPIEFEVIANETTTGIDICDWYGAEIPEKPN